MEGKNDFHVFCELVADQFRYGGKKYAHSGTRESTDVLFDKHGRNWLFGTIDKYTFRFKNCKREKDLLKIACYMYILWLKRGFYIMSKGINSPAIDTNVKTKLEQYDNFLTKVNENAELMAKFGYTFKQMQESLLDEEERETTPVLVNNENELYFADTVLVDGMSEILGKFSNQAWEEVSEYNLIKVFALAYNLWLRNFKDVAGQDTDTWNETGGKEGK